MCIILVKPANVRLRKDYLENCYKANGNGCGFASIENDKVVVEKGILEFETFWNMLDAVQNERPQSPMLVHFRIATSGEIDDFNCHPFQIDDKHALVHNGVLYDFSSHNSKVSDTYLFVDHIIKPMFERDKELFKTKFQRYLTEEAIGHRNKIAILSADGDFIIFNESMGIWDDGVWYSNKSYLPPPPPKQKKKKKMRHNYGGVKQPKPFAYRKVGGNKLLTGREINELTHEHRCKLKMLVVRKIVEPFMIDADMPAKGTPEFVQWWQERGIIVC